MDTLTMLNGLAHLLKTRMSVADVADHSDVAVTVAVVLNNHLFLAIQASDSTVKYFRLTEV